MPDDDVQATEAKRRRWTELQAEVRHDRQALAADCFLAAFLAPKREATKDEVPTSATLLGVLDGSVPETHSRVQAARRVCADARVLHWKLAFPQVFEGAGGFDVVLGNPPWERIKLQEQEFFAARAPEVAQARNAAARTRAIAALAAAPADSPERAVYEEFEGVKRTAEAASLYCHSETRYPLTGVGDVNTYALFAESIYRLTRGDGRAGFVVPTGIATDDSTKAFFREIANQRLVSLFDFRTGPGLFPDIGHQRFKFALVTIGRTTAAEFSFSLTAVAQLGDERRRFGLSSEELALLNPNTRTCPTFRSRADAELTKGIYRRIPVLIDETTPNSNSWGVSFMTMLHMANDSGRFCDTSSADTVSLYEAKMIHHFDHRWRYYLEGTRGDDDSRESSASEKANPGFVARPRYWVPRQIVAERLRDRGWSRSWLMGWRDITNSGNERTVVAAVFPLVATNHKLPLFLPQAPAPQCACLLADFSCLVHDYVTRQKFGGTSLTYFVVKQLPTLAPEQYTEADLDFIVPRVLELTYTAHDLASWARDLGYAGEPFPWAPERRALLRAELDAYYANLYGLTRDELRYVLDPADVMGPDYPSETFRVLKNNEMREFGEYRTQRLVLEAWDRLFGAGPGPIAPAVMTRVALHD
jgi:hypothetical protein